MPKCDVAYMSSTVIPVWWVLSTPNKVTVRNPGSQKAFSTAKSDRKSSCVHVLPVSVGSFLVPRLHSTVERGFSRVFGTHSSDLYLTIMALWKTCLGLAVRFNLVFCEIVSNKIVTNSSFILTPDGC